MGACILHLLSLIILPHTMKLLIFHTDTFHILDATNLFAASILLLL